MKAIAKKRVYLKSEADRQEQELIVRLTLSAPAMRRL
jgi:hypothetical protein